MGTQKTEEKEELYYTWKGNVDFVAYHDYKTAQDAAKEMGQKNADPPGFAYKEEAEAFSKGKWDEYIKKQYKQFDAAQYDAVAYTDGSFSSKDETTASYGLIIFFKDEDKPCIESGIIEDMAGGEKYKIVRYDSNGEKKEEKVCPFKSRGEKRDLVSGSQSTVGELIGTMRSIEICCKEKELKKILLIYDREGIKQGYDDRKDLDEAQGNVAY